MKTFSEFISESTEQFAVVQLGGSIGEKSISSVRELKGEKATSTKVYDNKEKAKDNAKLSNKRLSPGEKKYYRIKYVVAQIIDGVFTGK